MCCLSILLVWFLWLVAGLHLFFFMQKTAYEVRISDWSSDVCSSDLDLARELERHEPLLAVFARLRQALQPAMATAPCDLAALLRAQEIGRASCRDRVCEYVEISGVVVS